MATKKGAKKASTKIKATPAFDLSKLKPGGHVMYGIPIRDAIASGNIQEMKKIAASARQYVKEVQLALDKLEGKIS